MTVDPSSRGWNEHRHRGISGADLEQPLVLGRPNISDATLLNPLFGPVSRGIASGAAVIEAATGVFTLPTPTSASGSVRLYRAQGGSLTLQNPDLTAYGLFVPGDATNRASVVLAERQSCVAVCDGLNWWLIALAAPHQALRASSTAASSWSTTAVSTVQETDVQSGSFTSLGGQLEINVAVVFRHTAVGGLAVIGLGLDGSEFIVPAATHFAAANYLVPMSFTVLDRPPAGTHHYSVFANNLAAGTLSIDGGVNALCSVTEWLV